MNKKGKSPVDLDIVRELVALLDEKRLSEIEVEGEGLRVRVARQNHLGLLPGPLSGAAPAQVPIDTAPLAAEPVKGTIVTSPMVGTVYLSPQPGAPPFVKIGDIVKDETLCIVEAMKTMNPVPAPVPGRIAEIFVRDAQPVEFGEPLMRIE